MVIHNELVVIDFQDALMGSCYYDLASLLRDSYVILSNEMRTHLLDYYFKHARGKLDMTSSWDEFTKLFDLMAMQRNLKAAGRFEFIDVVKKNDSFLQYIKQTMTYVMDNLKKYPDYAPIRTLIGEYHPYVTK
jgi:hypothetical protein